MSQALPVVEIDIDHPQNPQQLMVEECVAQVGWQDEGRDCGRVDDGRHQRFRQVRSCQSS